MVSEALRFAPSPAHLVLPERLIRGIKEFSQHSCGRRSPDIFYSYKTNPVPGVLRILHKYGVGAEVISESELAMARHLGVAPDRIVYNGPAKSDESLEWAIEKRILAIHINHGDEMDRIAGIAHRMGRKARVGLRITAGGWGGQFGFKVQGGQALDALRRILLMPQCEVTSVHCHRGIPIKTDLHVRQHVGQILNFLTEARRATGWVPQMVDVGGSLAIPSTKVLSSWEKRFAWSLHIEPQAPNISLSISRGQYAALIISLVEAWSEKERVPMPQVVVEPGRSLTGDAQMLLTRVLDVRHEKHENFAILDAGHSIARIAADEYRTILPVKQTGRPVRTYRLVGPICHMGDILSRAWQGEALARGDLLAVMDAGAYFISDEASFSFGKPAIVCANRAGQVMSLRSKENFAEQFCLENFS